MPILGIAVERKADVLSLAAFILSFLALCTQIGRYVIGAHIQLLPPEQVIFTKSLNSHKEELTGFVLKLIYANDGAEGYAGVVVKESLTVTLNHRVYSYHGLDFVDPKFSKGTLDPENGRQDATAFVVDSGGVVSHHTRFTSNDDPGPSKSGGYLYWGALLSATKPPTTIDFNVVATDSNGRSVSSRMCRIDAPTLNEELTNKGWAAFPCREVRS